MWVVWAEIIGRGLVMVAAAYSLCVVIYAKWKDARAENPGLDEALQNQLAAEARALWDYSKILPWGVVVLAALGIVIQAAGLIGRVWGPGTGCG